MVPDPRPVPTRARSSKRRWRTPCSIASDASARGSPDFQAEWWPFSGAAVVEIQTEDRALVTESVDDFAQSVRDLRSVSSPATIVLDCRIEHAQLPWRFQIAQAGIDNQVKSARDEILIKRDRRGFPGDGIEIGQIEHV